MLRFESGVSRREIALAPEIWLMVAISYAVFAASAAAVPLLFTVESQGVVFAIGAICAVASVAVLVTSPPAPGSWRLHAVLAGSYCLPAAASCVLGVLTPTAYAATLFAGPLAAVWLVERRQIAAHLLTATVVLIAVPLACGAMTPTLALALLCAIPSIWGLAISCVGVLETAERQGRILEQLGSKDALTGLANRRGIDAALAEALRDLPDAPVSVITMDLNGFKAVNDDLGHDAGDAVLRDVAGVIRTCVRPGDTAGRQGGDEFVVIAPNTSAEQATVLVALIRAGLRELGAGDQAVSTGFGVATAPANGAEARALLDSADVALRADKQRTPSPRRRGPATRAVTSGSSAPVVPTIGRREMVAQRWLWRVTGAMLLLYAAGGASILILLPESIELGPVVSVLVVTGAAGLGIVCTSPPPIESVRSRGLLVLTYVLPVVLLAGTKQAGPAVIGLMVWIGPLVALRTVRRREALLHYLAATMLLLVAVVGGFVTAAATVAIIGAVATLWVLGYCCIVVFEGIEAQGAAIRDMVRRDPLTGLLNRRHLDELISSHAHMAAVLALDLNGFKALNDRVGHSAGDELLARVGTLLTRAVGTSGDVIRQGGDEFAIVLHSADAHEAGSLADRVRSLLDFDIDGVQMSTGVGIAVAPDDGTHLADLLTRADERLLADKAGPPSDLRVWRRDA